MLEKTEGVIKNGQPRETDSIGQTRMDNPEKLTALGTQNTRRRQHQKNKKHSTI